MIKKALKINRLNEDEFSQFQNAIAKTLEDSGLKAKGVSVIKATEENADEVKQLLQQLFTSNPFGKFCKKEQIETLVKRKFKDIFDGNQSCYIDKFKKIILPEKGLSLLFFHEAGHAMNYNFSKIGKLLKNCRYLEFFIAPIALIALFKDKKDPDEKPKNNFDKATTFIKNNAGKLTFAAFLPKLIDEGLASIKGYNLAKKALSPELVKKVAKTNILAFLTYLSSAVFGSLGIYLSVKVRDKLIDEERSSNNIKY